MALEPVFLLENEPFPRRFSRFCPKVQFSETPLRDCSYKFYNESRVSNNKQKGNCGSIQF